MLTQKYGALDSCELLVGVRGEPPTDSCEL